MKILYDNDVQAHLTYQKGIKILEDLLFSKLNKNVVHPPRDYFFTQKGALVFTKGELLHEKVAGFRLYAIPKAEQITVAIDTHTGGFKGIIIGKLLGIYRTACLNALAIKYLSRQNAQILGVIGSGMQAKHHTLAALEVRAIKKIRIYSRNIEKRKEFIQFIESHSKYKHLEIIAADSSEEVVANCDILICATNSPIPVFKTDALKKGLHINNIGPKYKSKHELSLDTYQKADLIATDSLIQLYDTTFLGAVCFTDSIPKENILELETCMTNFNRQEEAITLFCSMGLAGTEVAVANWLLEQISIS